MKNDEASRPRALLTGATGYIGSKLVERLLAEGWAVHVITRTESSFRLLGQCRALLTVHTHDGTTAGMIKVMEHARPDVVFHLASVFLAQHKADDISSLVASNILFGTQLLEAMAQANVCCLVNTGTSWQNYDNHDYDPVNLYAATKQAFEDITRYYIEAKRMSTITLRLFDTYGPDDPRPKLLALLKRAAMSGEVLEMSPGEQLIDLVYIDDVIECYLQAAARLRQGVVTTHEIYGVSSQHPIALRALVEVFSEATGLTVNVSWGSRPYRLREVMRPWSNYDCLPGWRAAVDMKTGFSSMIDNK